MDDLQNAESNDSAQIAESKFDDGAEARILAPTAHVPSPPSEKSFVAVPNATESVSTPLVSEAASPMPLDSFSDQPNKKVPRTKKAPSAPRAKKVKVEEAHVTDDESAGRFNEEDDEEHTKLYCICKSLYDEERMMIACDRCDEWYHTVCMKIGEDEVELVNFFICPPCEQETFQRTSYKPKCQREECKHAALRPLSKYCSEQCGVLVLSSRINKIKLAKNMTQKKIGEKLYHGRIASAKRREGMVIWEASDANPSSVEETQLRWLQSFLGTETVKHMFASVREGKADEASKDTRVPSQEDIQAVLPQLEEIDALSKRQRALDEERKRVNEALDTLAARTKLLQLADDRAATLEIMREQAEDDGGGKSAGKKAAKAKKAKSKDQEESEEAPVSAAPVRGQPGCGYDERLSWDNTSFKHWLHQPGTREILDEIQPLDGNVVEDMRHNNSSLPALVCGAAKRKCKRHADWSIVRAADYEVERELQTQRLSTLAEQSQQFKRRIQELGNDIQQSLLNERERHEHADETLAKILASEGSRRSIVW